MHRSGRRLATVVLLVAAASIAGGCAAAVGCPSWAAYATPLDALEEASAAVRGHVGERVGSEPLNGGSANVWEVEVTEWIKGEGAERVEVISPPSACGVSDDPYFGPDPFETAAEFDTAIVFMSERAEGWMALSPGQGVVEPGPDGTLPTAWPDETR